MSPKGGGGNGRVGPPSPSIPRRPPPTAQVLPFRHAEGAAGLLITLPGNLYGPDGALLFYPSVFLGSQGWDTLALTYGFQGAMAGAGPEAVTSAVQESSEAVRAALEGRGYLRIGLIGKSLGCGIAAKPCVSGPSLASARAAYLTPMLGASLFDPLFRQTRQPAYVAQGTADGFYDPAELEALREERALSLTLIEGADQSLVVPGDLSASIAALERVTREVIAFLTDRAPAS